MVNPAGNRGTEKADSIVKRAATHILQISVTSGAVLITADSFVR